MMNKELYLELLHTVLLDGERNSFTPEIDKAIESLQIALERPTSPILDDRMPELMERIVDKDIRPLYQD